MTTILLAGGGTAGHVNPLLAVADRLRELVPDAQLLVLGTREGLEARLVPDRGYELLTIDRVPFPRRPGGDALRFVGRFRTAIAQSGRHLADRSVDALVGFGGYASAPAYLAAHRARVPIAIHEANARPGLANRLGARYTPHVGVAFPGTRLRGAQVVGMPLRPEIERLDKRAARLEAAALWGLDPERRTLLVTGGSSGALRINRAVSASVPLLLGTGWQVLHVTGRNFDGQDPGLPGYRIVPYAERMELALAMADFAISRSGAATVAELAALGIPSALVPYAVGNGEQRHNARLLVDAGGALLVADARFDADWIASDLVPLLLDRPAIAALAARAAAVGSLDGAQRMAELALRALRDGPARPHVG